MEGDHEDAAADEMTAVDPNTRNRHEAAEGSAFVFLPYKWYVLVLTLSFAAPPKAGRLRMSKKAYKYSNFAR